MQESEAFEEWRTTRRDAPLQHIGYAKPLLFVALVTVAAFLAPTLLSVRTPLPTPGRGPDIFSATREAVGLQQEPPTPPDLPSSLAEGALFKQPEEDSQLAAATAESIWNRADSTGSEAGLEHPEPASQQSAAEEQPQDLITAPLDVKANLLHERQISSIDQHSQAAVGQLPTQPPDVVLPEADFQDPYTANSQKTGATAVLALLQPCLNSLRTLNWTLSTMAVGTVGLLLGLLLIKRMMTGRQVCHRGVHTVAWGPTVWLLVRNFTLNMSVCSL